MGKKIDKNISKNVSGKYSQKLIDHAKKSATDAPKTTSKKKTIPKTAEATGGLIGNKFLMELGKFQKISRQNNSETVTNEHDKQTPKERYLSLEERQKVIDDLRLI